MLSLRGLKLAVRLVFVSSSACLILGACAGIPDLPRNTELPVKEIYLHAVCELRDSFVSLTAPEYSHPKGFKPERWLVTVSVAPRVQSDLNLGGGFTQKSTVKPLSAKNLVTWALGPPGLQLDTNGIQSSSVTYTIKSKDLLKAKDLQCDRNSASYHVLARNLGVGAWLRRSVAALDATSIAEVDKPSYTSDIIVRFNGNGSYSFAFPLGADLVSLSGSYLVDEQLQILMTQLQPEKTFQVVTLPTGDNFGGPKKALIKADAASVEDAKNRLDLIQLQQSIEGLQLRP